MRGSGRDALRAAKAKPNTTVKPKAAVKPKAKAQPARVQKRTKDAVFRDLKAAFCEVQVRCLPAIPPKLAMKVSRARHQQKPAAAADAATAAFKSVPKSQVNLGSPECLERATMLIAEALVIRVPHSKVQEALRSGFKSELLFAEMLGMILMADTRRIDSMVGKSGEHSAQQIISCLAALRNSAGDADPFVQMLIRLLLDCLIEGSTRVDNRPESSSGVEDVFAQPEKLAVAKSFLEIVLRLAVSDRLGEQTFSSLVKLIQNRRALLLAHLGSKAADRMSVLRQQLDLLRSAVCVAEEIARRCSAVLGEPQYAALRAERRRIVDTIMHPWINNGLAAFQASAATPERNRVVTVKKRPAGASVAVSAAVPSAPACDRDGLCSSAVGKRTPEKQLEVLKRPAGLPKKNLLLSEALCELSTLRRSSDTDGDANASSKARCQGESETAARSVSRVTAASAHVSIERLSPPTGVSAAGLSSSEIALDRSIVMIASEMVRQDRETLSRKLISLANDLETEAKLLSASETSEDDATKAGPVGVSTQADVGKLNRTCSVLAEVIEQTDPAMISADIAGPLVRSLTVADHSARERILSLALHIHVVEHVGTELHRQVDCHWMDNEIPPSVAWVERAQKLGRELEGWLADQATGSLSFAESLQEELEGVQKLTTAFLTAWNANSKGGAGLADDGASSDVLSSCGDDHLDLPESDHGSDLDDFIDHSEEFNNCGLFNPGDGTADIEGGATTFVGRKHCSSTIKEDWKERSQKLFEQFPPPPELDSSDGEDVPKGKAEAKDKAAEWWPPKAPALEAPKPLKRLRLASA